MNDYVTKTIAVYDQIAQEYNKKIDAYAPRPEQEKFIKLIKPGSKILDAGCGPGRDSEYFAKSGFEVTGIDLSENLLAIAKKRAPQVAFIKQDLRNLTFPSESFAGIWACASLLHLKRQEVLPVIKSFFRLLTPDGILYVMVKEGKGEADVQDTLSPDLYRHFIYFSVNEVETLLKKGGFVVGEIYTWNTDSRHQHRKNLIWISSFSNKK